MFAFCEVIGFNWWGGFAEVQGRTWRRWLRRPRMQLRPRANITLHLWRTPTFGARLKRKTTRHNLKLVCLTHSLSSYKLYFLFIYFFLFYFQQLLPQRLIQYKEGRLLFIIFIPSYSYNICHVYMYNIFCFAFKFRKYICCIVNLMKFQYRSRPQTCSLQLEIVGLRDEDLGFVII